MPYDAVILAGGRAARLGGADKPGAPVGGLPLIARVAAAVPDAGRLIVVGPPPPLSPRAAGTPQARAVLTREDPPGSGPIPALRAGLAQVRAELLALLAADLPFLTAGHVALLLERARRARAGAVLTDEAGGEQWLIGAWRTGVLAAALGRYRGTSLRGLLGPLGPDPVRIAVPEGERPPWFDCDTPDDLARARRWAEPASRW
ncbi:MAG: NTP transferase domain-containing protein [Thermobispora bispora]|nr:NTP transferase domain-containing protein [Thermobispora bispora]